MRRLIPRLFLPIAGILVFAMPHGTAAQDRGDLGSPGETRADTTYGEVGEWFAIRALTGDVMQFPELQGRVLFVNFWATWCAPCVEEMPTIVDLADSLIEEDISFLLISIDDDRRAARRFAKKHGLADLIYFPEWEPGASTFQAGIVPASFIIDRNGAIAYQHHGAANWNMESIRRFLKKKAAG